MSNHARHKVTKLIRRDGPHCHYCNCHLYRSQGTLDHVVPKSFGGPNCLENYVLACSDCNELRGTDLNWCDCDFCGPLLDEYRDSPAFYDRAFGAIMAYNKPVIKFRTRVWKVYLHRGEQHHFQTWDEALHFALTYGKEPARVIRRTV